jgi:hypothetical protein
VISSLLHTNVRLEGRLEPRLLVLLDGTRNRGALTAAVGMPQHAIDAALDRFASVGFLTQS